MRHRRGISLMMVMAFVAVASVMGMAMLSSSTLQAMGSNGQSSALQADALAESGMNLGLYYLQNINDSTKCPLTLTLGGRTYVRNGATLGSGVAGNFDLAIVRTGIYTYTLRSTGRVTNSSGKTVQRTINTDVKLGFYGHGLSLTTGTAGTLTIPAKTTINGSLYATQPVTNNGTINGTLYADVVSGSGTALLTAPLDQALGVTPVPTVGTVNHYFSYSYNNRIYLAEILVSDTLAGRTLGPSATNPAGIFYYGGTLKLIGNVVVNGTLVVTENLRVTATNNVITPVDGFPALVVDANVKFCADGSQLTANGLVWMGGKVDATGDRLNCAFNVNGALLCAFAGSPLLDAVCAINITFDRDRASVPTLRQGSTMAAPTGLSISTWK